MPSKQCPNCGSTELETDLSAGNVVCMACFAIVESGILVSELGFAEGSGGRMHVQGAFVSNYSTGFTAFGSRGEASSENVKRQGKERIQMVADQMGISSYVSRPAQRFFGLAVDAKFNRGRRTEYIVASCLYLQCRYSNSDKMLIDFSERLNINVFELGATYLKLRAALHLKDPMPEVDPAIYNVRFAHRLDFGTQNVKAIAADASRLVRRFKADWMTQGRRPAGICGACMIIAARMHGFLRTPDEVAQVVKVSPITIRRRLKEFARTSLATQTVEQFRALSDAELGQSDPSAEPPVVRAAREKKQADEEKRTIERIRGQGGEDENGDEDEYEAQGASNKRRRKGKKDSREKLEGRGSGAVQAKGDVDGVILAAANEVAADEDDDYDDGGGQGAEDVDLGAMEASDYIAELNKSRDNPEEVAEEVKRKSRAFKREMRAFNNDSFEPAYDDDADLDDLISDMGYDKESDDGSAKEEGDDDDDDDDDELCEIDEKGEHGPSSSSNKAKGKGKATDDFDQWDDKEATIKHLGQKYFADEADMFKLTEAELAARVAGWVTTRDPRVVVREIQAVEAARKERERYTKKKAETDFTDLDDAELEEYFVMREDETRLKARMWLSSNGAWLQEEKDRQEKRAAYNKAHGIDPSKPKPKRKKRLHQKGPYPSARDAVQSLSIQKKFSSRVNYAALGVLGLGDDEPGGDYGESELQTFDDDKEDDKEDDWRGGEKDDQW